MVRITFLKRTVFICFVLLFCSWERGYSQSDKEEIMEIIYRVNDYWQTNHPNHGRAFWDNAAYHTGNMEAYLITGEERYRKFSEDWAEHNEWKGAKSDDRSEWKYGYGETDDYVLFGDYQICFQVYADLYQLDPEERKIARAIEVMEYQMMTPYNDYWWWADGLYMVMPVMTKLHNITDNPLYLEKLYEYLSYSNSIMYDEEEGLYYRDARYVYPGHTTVNGKKDFWARGDGWVFAGFAKVLSELPETDEHRPEYIDRFRTMAKAIAACQRVEGFWTRSLLDASHAPGRETSGTAFFTYGLFWGINNGFLSVEEYLPVALKGWNYLSTIALQEDGKVGYVQPIGENATPGQSVNRSSTANFGVGAFLLAACEYVRYLESPVHTSIKEMLPVESGPEWLSFPKPFSGFIHLLHPENMKSVEIISTTGKRILHFKGNIPASIPVAGFPSGCYIIRGILREENRPRCVKLMIH